MDTATQTEPDEHPDPLVPVMFNARQRTWPKFEHGGRVPYMPVSVALTRHHDFDAHTAAWSVPSIERRLSKGAIEQLPDGVPILFAVFDCDDKETHKAKLPASESWRAEHRARVLDLLHDQPGGFSYDTRGGNRLLYRLYEPFVIKTAEDVAKWKRQYHAWCNYLARVYGIEADHVIDWQRLFRLPHVVRDGVCAKPEIIGDPNNIGTWNPAITEADYPPEKIRTVAAPREGAIGSKLSHGLFHELFNRRGWVDRKLDGEDDAYIVRCPWESEHSCGETFDGSTILYVKDDAYGSLGWLYCLHAGSCFERRTADDVLALFPESEVYKLEGKCGEKVKTSGKTCAAVELYSDRLCVIHSSTPEAKKARREHAQKVSPGDNRFRDGTTSKPANDDALAPDSGGNSEWEPPIPFTAVDLPPFPVDALPPALAIFVKAEAEATQTAPDLCAMLSLAACAAALSKRVVVRVNDGYKEPLNLYAVSVLSPGERKTAVLSDVTAPLVEWEKNELEKREPEIRRATQRQKLSEKRLEKAMQDAVKASRAERERAELELENLSNEHAAIKVPVEPRLLADDVTPEQLATLMSLHGGRMALFSAEGGIIGMIAGRYSENTYLDPYLKGHSGESLLVDRRGRKEHVDAAALTLGLAVQPAMLEKLAEHPNLRGVGLLARFLWTIPTARAGTRNVNPPPVAAEIRAGYAALMHLLLNLPESDQPIEMKLSSEAHAAYLDFARWVEPQLAEFGDLGEIRDWGAKLVGAVLRIAGIVGIVGIVAYERRFKDPSIYMEGISLEDFNRAAAIGRYLIPHAKAAFAAVGSNPKVENARKALRYIERRGWQHFDRRQIQQALKNSLSSEELDAALDMLAERGYVRGVRDEREGAGQRKVFYTVNPLSHYPQYPHNGVTADSK